MKRQSILIAGLVIALVASYAVASAQQFGDVPVKILPTTEKGIVKVWFATPVNQDVQIKFFKQNETLGSYKVEKANYPNGFSKKYDLSKVPYGNLWVEVSSPSLDVTYKLVPSKDGHTFEAQLETTTYNHTVVAANN